MSMRDMPSAHPQFDLAITMRESELKPLGFAPVARFSVVNREFRVTDRQLPPIGPRYIYAFVVDDEVIRIGSSLHLPSRFDQYGRDVTDGITGKMQLRTKMTENHLTEEPLAKFD